MIMSYLAKIEMSGFENAKLSYFKGGQIGRKGHYHVESEGVEEVTRNQEGAGWSSKANQSSGDAHIE
jgi:hypothetical protein